MVFSSKSLQFYKASLALLVTLSIGCQKGYMASPKYSESHAGVRDPVITPFTDFPGQEQIPILSDNEEQAPAEADGPDSGDDESSGEGDDEKSSADDSQAIPEGMNAEDLSEPAKMKPTIYYHPVIKDSNERCTDEQRKDLLSVDDKVLKRVCEADYGRCSIQGTCTFVEGEERRSFNHHSQRGGVDRYFEMKPSRCIYGFGVSNICLDPFYTVAADLSVYRPGTVIYVPAVRGAVMPNGKPHTGFFVVRDRGGGVKGAGRFDFFTGSYSWNSANNPFKSLALGDPRKTKTFYVVKSQEAAASILKERNYPSLP